MCTEYRYITETKAALSAGTLHPVRKHAAGAVVVVRPSGFDAARSAYALWHQAITTFPAGLLPLLGSTSKAVLVSWNSSIT